MAAYTQIEFAVKMVCGSCEQSVRKVLESVEGIKNVKVNVQMEQVIVETTLPADQVKTLLETTGKKVVLTGFSSQKEFNLGAAVAIIEIGSDAIKGVVRFVQSDVNKCLIEGTIDGLPPGNHCLYLHEYGDVSDGCKSCGPVSGLLGLTNMAEGMITELKVGEMGRAEFRTDNYNLRVSEIIGRSLVVHKDKSLMSSYKNRLSCGIIARSAGVFENSKKICACDGTSIWDEKLNPLSSRS